MIDSDVVIPLNTIYDAWEEFDWVQISYRKRDRARIKGWRASGCDLTVYEMSFIDDSDIRINLIAGHNRLAFVRNKYHEIERVRASSEQALVELRLRGFI